MFLDRAMLEEGNRIARRRRQRERKQRRDDGLISDEVVGWLETQPTPWIAGQFRRPRDNLAEFFFAKNTFVGQGEPLIAGLGPAVLNLGPNSTLGKWSTEGAGVVPSIIDEHDPDASDDSVLCAVCKLPIYYRVRIHRNGQPGATASLLRIVSASERQRGLHRPKLRSAVLHRTGDRLNVFKQQAASTGRCPGHNDAAACLYNDLTFFDAEGRKFYESAYSPLSVSAGIEKK